ncbi:hypothetical protein DFP73DRAFT_569324 [Morchella snyderi]|nr:hypothetical protein DFP73DRAFT_569324 [Morchella snyderi]
MTVALRKSSAQIEGWPIKKDDICTGKTVSGAAQRSTGSGAAVDGRVEVDKVDEAAAEKEREEMRRWLLDGTPPDERHSEVCFRLRRNTGAWFLKCAEVRAWVSGKVRYLLCVGDPGVGKTFLTSRLTTLLSTTGPANTGVAHIYFTPTFPPSHDPATILRHILSQLLPTPPVLPAAFTALYTNSATKKDRPPTTDDLTTAIAAVAAANNHTYILVDALDACKATERARVLSALWALPGVQIFVSSRPSTVDLRQDADTEVLTVEGAGVEADVRRVVRAVVQGLVPCEVPEVVDLIMETARGGILLAVCLAAYVLRAESAGVLNDRLADMPGSITDYFATTMRHLRDSDTADLGLRVIRLVTLETHPLRLDELCALLAVAAGESLPGAQQTAETIAAATLGLVTVEAPTGVCRLLHRTFREFLSDHEPALLADATRERLRAYLALMSLRPPLPTDPVAPLYTKATKIWPLLILHKYPSSDLHTLVISAFAQHPTELSAAVRHAVDGRPPRPRSTALSTALHAAACFGLPSLARRLLSDGAAMDPTDAYGRTPLSWAAERNHFNVVTALLDSGNVDVESRGGEYGQSALHYAAAAGNSYVVRLLVGAGADVHGLSATGQSVVACAAEGGHRFIVENLLGQGAVGGLVDVGGRNALDWAMRGGDLGTVRALAEAGVEPGSGAVWMQGAPVSVLMRRVLSNARIRMREEEERVPCMTVSTVSEEVPPAPVVEPAVETGGAESWLDGVYRLIDYLFDLAAELAMPRGEQWEVIGGFWVISVMALVLASAVGLVFGGSS